MATYFYGKLTKSKFFTPNRAYQHSTVFPSSLIVNNYFPCIINNNSVEVFYNSPVFNSYVTVVEEEVSKLYSKDGKMTITRSKLNMDTLYTFRVIEETNKIRVCEIINYDNILWVGKNTTGKLSISKRKCEVNTPIGKGECILQNYKHPKTLKLKLWKIENDKMFFVEIENPIKESFEVFVDDIKENCMRVSNQGVRGIILGEFKDEVNYKNKKRREEPKSVKVYVKEELLGFYIFGISSDLFENALIETTIVEKTNDKFIIKYQNHVGFIKLENVEPGFFNLVQKNKKIVGRIIKINDNEFELSQEQKISVPFDIDESESLSESTEIEDKNKIGSLSDILNLIKKLTENKKFDEVHHLYTKHINTLGSNDRDNLSIVYYNFLEYIKEDSIKEIKKISKNCTDKFITKVGLGTEKFDVIDYCYNKVKSKELYTKYIEMSIINNIDIKDYLYMDVVVDLFYKYKDNPRIEIEKIIGNNKSGWLKYIENEKDDYKRLLYRRVVKLKWKVSDMKEWYRMWMNFEKEEGGNIEEVRKRAKEFVESIKKKE